MTTGPTAVVSIVPTRSTSGKSGVDEIQVSYGSKVRCPAHAQLRVQSLASQKFNFLSNERPGATFGA